MSDLTTYLNLGCRHMSICDSVEKDTRLQDIADKRKAMTEANSDMGYVNRRKELFDLLDALTQEDNDE